MRRGQASLFLLVVVLGLIVFFYFSQLSNPIPDDAFPLDASQIDHLSPLPAPRVETQTVHTASIPNLPSAGVVTRTFRWRYNNRPWSLQLHFDASGSEVYDARSRLRNYDLFASDPYDDGLMEDLASQLKALAKDNRLSKGELPYFVASFVQALPYTSDEVTTPFDEYPRFPYETLIADGGDCEDTSILAAALLQELGYGVVLLELPKHMAVGVECSDEVKGASVWLDSKRYCYLETTGENWPIGQIPDEYKGSDIKVISIEKRPALQVNFTSIYRYNQIDLFADIFVTVKNLGSATARNTTILAALQTSDESHAWDSAESDSLVIAPEDEFAYNVTNLHMPSGEVFRVYVRAIDGDSVSDEAVSQWITWNSE